MNILCCLLCFNVVCRCYNWTLSSEICIRGDFLLTELFTSLCDTFQFWQILTDSEQLQSLLASAGTRTSSARSTNTLHTSTRARAAFPNIRTPGCGFHARWRNPDRRDFLEERGLWGNVASWKPCRKLDESEEGSENHL